MFIRAIYPAYAEAEAPQPNTQKKGANIEVKIVSRSPVKFSITNNTRQPIRLGSGWTEKLDPTDGYVEYQQKG